MLFYLGIVVLAGYAVSVAAGYFVSGLMYPGARIGFLPDGMPKRQMVVLGLALAAILVHFTI